MRELRRSELFCAAAAAGILLLIPLLAPGDYYIYVVALGLSYVIAALGLNVLMGYGPIISLGQSGFFAIGAYATGILLQRGAPLYIALPASGILGGLMGIAVALPVLRLHGLYLAIGTLAFALIVQRFIENGGAITGGFSGLSIYTDFSVTEQYYIVIGVTTIMTLMYRNLIASGFGALLQSVRDHETAAIAMGVNVARIKLSAFAIAAVFAAVGGSLYSVVVGFLVGFSFSLNLTLTFIVMVVVGGSGSIYGPFLGAILVTLIPELFRGSGLQTLLMGGSIVVVLLFMPKGLAGALRQLWGRPIR